MLLTILERLGRRRQRPGASGVWTAVAFAAFLLRQYQRRAARDAISLREELRPGESLLITHTRTPYG
jgi:hypothetical protein